MIKSHRIPRRGEWTFAALDVLPKDGHVYEIIDGELEVLPPPDDEHDRALWNLLLQLMPFAKQQRWSVDVHLAPVAFSTRRFVRPDLILATDSTSDPAPLNLVVEVTSPYSRRTDAYVKRELYLHERVWQYWILDVERQELIISRQDDTNVEFIRDSHTWQTGLRCDPLHIVLSDILSTTERSVPDVTRHELFPPPFVFSEGQRATSGNWTVELLDAIRPNGCRREIFDGRLSTTPPHSPFSQHQRALIDLRSLLGRHAEKLGVKVVMGPINIDVSPTCRVIPDFVGYRESAWKRARSTSAAPARPCLIVDLLSEYSKDADLEFKRQMYQRLGVQEYWIVDLEARKILLWKPKAHKPVVFQKTMVSEPVSRRGGVKIDVARFFGLLLGG